MGWKLTPLTPGQAAFFFSWTITLLLWLYAEYLNFFRRRPTSPKGSDVPDDKELDKLPPDNTVTVQEQHETQNEPLFVLRNPVTSVLLMEVDAMLEARLVLRAMAEFGMHMSFYYLCDRANDLSGPMTKYYDRDLFWFLYILIIIYNFVTSIHKGKSPLYLNRDQTEEWKGWMQILFLMYHYFEATEQYNSIRLYIAAYVWMTGFGNFSFYYIRKDFSPARFCQMMWRLNFLVFWTCTVLNNDYMLYYICPMHTLWTIFVYLALLIGKEYNTNNNVVLAKFVLSALVVVAMWSSKSVFYTLWSPLLPLVKYVNPSAKPGTPGADPMHEWFFRGGLDRYIWIFGMICANFHPNTEKFLTWMDGLPTGTRRMARGMVVAIVAMVMYFYCTNFFFLPKYQYNEVHPYTSWIPIACYIIIRNLTPELRTYSLAFFGWLGKITLETYIGQFHVWLYTGIPNGQPKRLMCIIPNYFMLNFLLVTVVYIWVSYRIFYLTNDLKNAFLPKDNRRLLRNIILITLTWTPCYIIGHILSALLAP